MVTLPLNQLILFTWQWHDLYSQISKFTSFWDLLLCIHKRILWLQKCLIIPSKFLFSEHISETVMYRFLITWNFSKYIRPQNWKRFYIWIFVGFYFLGHILDSWTSGCLRSILHAMLHDPWLFTSKIITNSRGSWAIMYSWILREKTSIICIIKIFTCQKYRPHNSYH